MIKSRVKVKIGVFGIILALAGLSLTGFINFGRSVSVPTNLKFKLSAGDLLIYSSNFTNYVNSSFGEENDSEFRYVKYLFNDFNYTANDTLYVNITEWEKLGNASDPTAETGWENKTSRIYTVNKTPGTWLSLHALPSDILPSEINTTVAEAFIEQVSLKLPTNDSGVTYYILEHSTNSKILSQSTTHLEFTKTEILIYNKTTSPTDWSLSTQNLTVYFKMNVNTYNIIDWGNVEYKYNVTQENSDGTLLHQYSLMKGEDRLIFQNISAAESEDTPISGLLSIPGYGLSVLLLSAITATGIIITRFIRKEKH